MATGPSGPRRCLSCLPILPDHLASPSSLQQSPLSPGGLLGAEIIARHRRSYVRGDVVYDPLHYLSLLEKKPGALDQAAPLRGWKLDPAFATLCRLSVRDRSGSCASASACRSTAAASNALWRGEKNAHDSNIATGHAPHGAFGL